MRGPDQTCGVHHTGQHLNVYHEPKTLANVLENWTVVGYCPVPGLTQ